MTNIEKTIEYVKDLFDNSEYYKNHQDRKQYRLDHTFRVANIGKEIASKEGLNVEAVVIGCLIHDISYIYDFKTNEERKAHGRKSASMAKQFIDSLEMDELLKEQLLYGVAIHVDGKADYIMEESVLAETISECDNIDRFDAYRLYEGLLYSDLSKKTLEEQITFCENQIKRLESIKEYVFKTKTSNDLWNEKLDYQSEYFNRLLIQLNTSNSSLLLK